MRLRSLAVPFIVALSLASLFNSCSRGSRRSVDRDQNGRGVEDVASAPADPATLKQIPNANAVLRLARVPSTGACAPVYKTGQIGACINDTPCRGFGVRTEAGQILCTCYGQIGGCAATERCDDRKVICVPDDEPPFDRPRPR
jgi:hypothetical protein